MADDLATRIARAHGEKQAEFQRLIGETQTELDAAIDDYIKARA